MTVQPAFRWGLGCSGLHYDRPRTRPPRPCLCHRRAVSGTGDKRILKCVSLPPREVAAISAPTREAGECLSREAPHKGAGSSLSPPGRRARWASCSPGVEAASPSLPADSLSTCSGSECLPLEGRFSFWKKSCRTHNLDLGLGVGVGFVLFVCLGREGSCRTSLPFRETNALLRLMHFLRRQPREKGLKHV